MGVNRYVRLTAACVAFCGFCFGQNPPLLDTLAGELDRNFRLLSQKADPKPYFISYAVTESESGIASATLGASQGVNRRHSRLLDVNVRVGSPSLDNYHRLPGNRPPRSAAVVFPIEDAPDAIRQRVWLETDRTYRTAAETFLKVRTSTEVKAAAADPSNDFSTEEPSVFSQAPAKLYFPAEEMAARAGKWSAVFARYPAILASNVVVAAQRETKYLVNTEGTRLQHGRTFARIVISAQARAADGENLSLGESFEAEDVTRLPKDAAVQEAAERVARDLTALVRAPVVEPFVGPALLSGRATGVFFHEIFGHRVEGHRQKDESEGQTFAKSLGTSVLPPFLSVIFDPTRRQAAGADLNGAYLYDDEGVKAGKVPVVENGILKAFLMSRSPIRGFDRSNGHGRGQPGADPVSRQSNLFVESSKKVPEAELRRMLIEEVRRQGKPYGLYFARVTGGYTTTARRGLQAFTVIPVMVYRVYPDGRPDELVRGADIVGTPLASFARILATGDRQEVFNGYCGAESGSVPVSAVAPALLVSEIEVQKKEKSGERPPLLPRPVPAAGGGN